MKIVADRDSESAVSRGKYGTDDGAFLRRRRATTTEYFAAWLRGTERASRQHPSPKTGQADRGLHTFSESDRIPHECETAFATDRDLAWGKASAILSCTTDDADPWERAGWLRLTSWALDGATSLHQRAPARSDVAVI
jgi:hypothetical protein